MTGATTTLDGCSSAALGGDNGGAEARAAAGGPLPAAPTSSPEATAAAAALAARLSATLLQEDEERQDDDNDGNIVLLLLEQARGVLLPPPTSIDPRMRAPEAAAAAATCAAAAAAFAGVGGLRALLAAMAEPDARVVAAAGELIEGLLPQLLLAPAASGARAAEVGGSASTAAARHQLCPAFVPRRLASLALSGSGGGSGASKGAAAAAMRALLSGLRAWCATAGRNGTAAAAASAAADDGWADAAEALIGAAAARAGAADGPSSLLVAPEVAAQVAEALSLLAAAAKLEWPAHPAALLLRLYRSIAHDGAAGAGDATAAAAAPARLAPAAGAPRCCAAAAAVLLAAARASGSASASPPPPPPLKVGEELLAIVSDLTTSGSRTRAARRLAWDGSTAAFEQRPAACFPCSGGGGGGGSGGALTPLEAALEALASYLRAAGAPAARHLHSRHDLAAALRRLCEFECRGTLARTQCAVGAAAAGCAALREELLQGCDAGALTGMLLHGSRAAAAGAPPFSAAQLAAAEKLCAAADALPGRGFAHVAGAGAAGAGAEVCALAFALEVVSGALRRLDDGSGGDGGDGAGVATATPAPPAAATARMLEALGQLVLAALERSRRTVDDAATAAGMPTAGPAPRAGAWRALSPEALLALEARLKRPAWWCAVAAPPPAPAPATTSVAPASPPAAAAAAGSSGQSSSSSALSGSSRDKESGTGSGNDAGGGGGGFDEDGVRVAWSSGPTAEQRAARAAWRALPLEALVAWQQSAADVEVHVMLPAGMTKRDVAVVVAPDRLTVSLAWAGRVLDGPLWKRVRASDAVWSLSAVDARARDARAAAGLLPAPPEMRPGAAAAGTSAGASGSAAAGTAPARLNGAPAAASAQPLPPGCVDLMIVLPKAEAGRYWRALFEGGAEKSHWELLHEAVHNEDDALVIRGGGGARGGGSGSGAPSLEEAGPEARQLLEALLERQRLVAEGAFDLERSFDDFRLVVGDATL